MAWIKVNDLIRFWKLMSTLFTNLNHKPLNCYNFGVLEHKNCVVCLRLAHDYNHFIREL